LQPRRARRAVAVAFRTLRASQITITLALIAMTAHPSRHERTLATLAGAALLDDDLGY
jgi:hypothetical protein